MYEPQSGPSSIPPLPGEYSPAEAITALSRQGYRVTAPRRAVVTAALRQERPFTAEQLVAETASGEGESGRSTVYRTLEILASLGILSRILNETGRPVYVAGAPSTGITSSAPAVERLWPSAPARSAIWRPRWREKTTSRCMVTCWRSLAPAAPARAASPDPY
jgi:hypothetical protein